LKIPGHEKQELALVHWYNFKYNNPHWLFKYDCTHIKSVPIFTIIAIDSIVEQ
ncbi:16855_t:CDS:1, partial [Funneliformis caledonium]